MDTGSLGGGTVKDTILNFIIQKDGDLDEDSEEESEEDTNQDSQDGTNEDNEEEKLEVKFGDQRLILERYKRDRKVIRFDEDLRQKKTEELEKSVHSEKEQSSEKEENSEEELSNPQKLEQMIQSDRTREFSLSKFEWLSKLASELKTFLFKNPRQNSLKKTFQIQSLSASKREFRRAQGMFKKFVELEMLSEFLDSSRNFIRCHIICPGVPYGLGRGPFVNFMRRLWANGGRRKEIWGDFHKIMKNEFPMVHWQDLAMGVKWFLFNQCKRKRDHFGFFESVLESDFRELQAKQDENDEIDYKTDFLQTLKKKRRKIRHKDGYILFSDQNPKRLLGDHVETILKEFYDIKHSSEKISFTFLEERRRELFALTQVSSDMNIDSTIQYPYGFRNNPHLDPIEQFNCLFSKNFRIKRSTFLDKANTAKPWEQILKESKEEALDLDELEKEAVSEDEEAEDMEDAEDSAKENEEEFEELEEEEFDFEENVSEAESEEDSDEDDFTSLYKGSKASFNKLVELEKES